MNDMNNTFRDITHNEYKKPDVRRLSAFEIRLLDSIDTLRKSGKVGIIVIQWNGSAWCVYPPTSSPELVIKE